MTFIWLLLILVVETVALIKNGMVESCGNTLCGYEAECRDQVCWCKTQRISTQDVPQVQYCLELCGTNDYCPDGTICKHIGANNYRCDCDTGYTRSTLGKCINRNPTTEHTKIPDTSTKDSTDSPLYIGLGVGVASFVLITIILVTLTVFIRRRKRSIRSPSSMSREGGTVIYNTFKSTTPNAQGERPNQYSESPVDLSDESNVNSKGINAKIAKNLD